MQHVIAPEERYLVALARVVKAGEEVEVDDDTAASLIDQGWTSRRQLGAKQAAKTRAKNAEDTSSDDTEGEE